MNEQLIEYLKSPDKDTHLLGFEILNNLKLSKKEKVFILYSSGYKEWDDSNGTPVNIFSKKLYTFTKGRFNHKTINGFEEFSRKFSNIHIKDPTRILKITTGTEGHKRLQEALKYGER